MPLRPPCADWLPLGCRVLVLFSHFLFFHFCSPVEDDLQPDEEGMAKYSSLISKFAADAHELGSAAQAEIEPLVRKRKAAGADGDDSSKRVKKEDPEYDSIDWKQQLENDTVRRRGNRRNGVEHHSMASMLARAAPHSFVLVSMSVCLRVGHLPRISCASLRFQLSKYIAANTNCRWQAQKKCSSRESPDICSPHDQSRPARRCVSLPQGTHLLSLLLLHFASSRHFHFTCLMHISVRIRPKSCLLAP